MTAILPGRMHLGTWTILAEGSEAVQATVTRERESYVVRDAHGRVVGRFGSAGQALASLPRSGAVDPVG